MGGNREMKKWLDGQQRTYPSSQQHKGKKEGKERKRAIDLTGYGKEELEGKKARGKGTHINNS